MVKWDPNAEEAPRVATQLGKRVRPTSTTWPLEDTLSDARAGPSGTQSERQGEEGRHLAESRGIAGSVQGGSKRRRA
jgi:hypothetical protein